MKALFETNMPDIKLVNRGQVWDIYELDNNRLLMVATDRISVFDVVLPTPIPGKGKALMAMSRFWFNRLGDIIPNHFLSDDVIADNPHLEPYREQLEGRSMLVRRSDVLPIECVVRGYITGSGWREYEQKGSVCGIKLKRGLKVGQRLERPLFTPGMKSGSGHYKNNITYDQMADIVGESIAGQIRDASINIYNRGRETCAKRGLILADVKLVYGLVDGRLTLIDEVMTSDVSRLWPRDNFTPGKVQASYDKQIIRDYLEGIGWDKRPPAPELPDKVIDKTVERYVEAVSLMTGESI